LPTIRDVAKLAGVAPITVSRVINNDGYFTEETRQKVEAAVLELNYIPNSLGPSLRSKRTQTLALVLSDITNPFWTTVARGVEDAANRRGYHIIIGNTDESEQKQEEYLLFLMKKQVDGFLFVPAAYNVSNTLQKRRVPFVILDRRFPYKEIDSVRCDSVGGAFELTKHLLELGHVHIAILTGRPGHTTSVDRVEGYLQALKEAGISDSQQIIWGEYTQQSGYENTVQILQAHPRPSAIFAANNFIAIGMMRALRDAGLRVPEDISVVAFDDLPAAITIDPFFTVAAQPAYEMGQKATELLLSRLEDNAPQGYQEIVLPVEIIVRKSSSQFRPSK
jgi:LacI family transcriptional regulator